MVAVSPSFGRNEKEALLIMFGDVWQRKFHALDGQKGRPSIADCIDFALNKVNNKAKEDLVMHIENYLRSAAKRCQNQSRKI